MNRETVGNENLPNVFIEKIDIYPGTGSRKKIIVRISMYDHLPNRSWFGVINELQIKLAFIAGEEIQLIQNPLISLYNFDVALEGVFTDYATSLVEAGEEISLDEEFTKFIMDFEYSLEPVDNLNVYVACFIDDLNFGNDLFDKFYGPMSGEKIYVGGQINKNSGYFYYPDTDEEYAGPVHAHPIRDAFMEGSVHSDKPHRTVRYVEEDNYKITEVTPLDDPGYVDPAEGETTIEGEVIG